MSFSQDASGNSVWQHPTVPPSTLTPNESLGRFRIVEMIGRGGMGEVWKAFDPHRQTHVVIKLLPLLQLGNEVELRRIRESFRKVSKLQHQHICPVYDLDTDKTVGHYLVMKFIEGETLAVYRYRLAKTEGGVTAQHAVDVLRPIALALDYAHKEKVIHRDVKPQNIMVVQDGKDAQLVDFGLADEIRLSATRTSRAQLDISGTYPYMSPEQWRGRQQDGRTDQYALAAVVYEFISGHPPFESADATILRECVLNEPVPPLPSLSNNANNVLRQALAKEPDQRFASCSQFLDAFAVALEDNSQGFVQASSLPTEDASPKNIDSHPTVVGAANSPKPTAPPMHSHPVQPKKVSTRSKETWYTVALALTIVVAAWLMRSEWGSSPSSAPNSNSTALNTPPTTTPPGTASIPGSGSGGASPVPSPTSSAPSSSPSISIPLSTAPAPPTPTNAPSAPPVSSQPPTPPPANAALLRQVNDSQKLANKAKEDAANAGAEQYARNEWNRADSLLSTANSSFTAAQFDSALEQYQESARAFYTSIDHARKAYEIRRNAQQLFSDLTKLREEAESAGAERLAVKPFTEGAAASSEMKRLYEAEDYSAASVKLEEAKSNFRTAIVQARAMEKVELARNAYNAQISGIDPKLLEQHGGQPWQKALLQIEGAESAKDIAKIESSYAYAMSLLPNIHAKIREEEIAGLSASGNHRQILDILWPNIESLDPEMKKTFITSASVSPQWWLEKAVKQMDSVSVDAHNKAMLYVGVSEAYRQQGDASSAKGYIRKAMDASLKVNDSREAMETSFEIAQEIDGRSDPTTLSAVLTQANVDLDSISQAGLRYPYDIEVRWIKYFFPIRFAALCWRAGDRDNAERYSQLAYSSRGHGEEYAADLSAFQGIMIFAEAGDDATLSRMPYVDKGRLLFARMLGVRPFQSLQDSELFRPDSEFQSRNSTYEMLAQAEIGLAAARAGDQARYRVHSRIGESMAKESATTARHTWNISITNSRLAMGEAYQEEFVASAGRIRNSVKHRFPLGEAALTLGRRQLASRSDVINNGIEGAKSTLAEFAEHPRMNLLAKEIATSMAKLDMAAAIDWMNLLESDHLRIAAMTGIAVAVGQ